jgi:hypothetical protein
LDAGYRVGAPAAGGARRSRAAGPSRPSRMLRCLDLCPEFISLVSFGCASLWVRVVGTARLLLRGAGLACPRALAPKPYDVLS